jgi:hypothetical protein
MILDLHRQGLSVSTIARQVGVDRRTVSACAAARSEGSESNVFVTTEGNHYRVDL